MLTFLFYRPDLDRLRCLLPFLKGGSTSRRHTDSTDLKYPALPVSECVRVAIYHGSYTAHIMESCVQLCWTMHGSFSNLAVCPPEQRKLSFEVTAQTRETKAELSLYLKKTLGSIYLSTLWRASIVSVANVMLDCMDGEI